LGGRGAVSAGLDSACANFTGGLLCFFGAIVAAAAGAATTGSVVAVAAGTVADVAAGTVVAEADVVCATDFVAGVLAEVTTGFGAGVEAAATGFGLGGVTVAGAFFRPPKSGSLFQVVCNAAGAGFPAGTWVEPIFVLVVAGSAMAVAGACCAGAGFALAVGGGVDFGVGAGLVALGVAAGLTGAGAGVADWGSSAGWDSSSFILSRKASRAFIWASVSAWAESGRMIAAAQAINTSFGICILPLYPKIRLGAIPKQVQPRRNGGARPAQLVIPPLLGERERLARSVQARHGH